ncbi:DDE-type integrase/transposase/recombinase, partial [Myxococcus sp. AB025B]|uniref:DDE-type integrase/transposase/recombinase n=1 Tax=Myxococcus sp. AB025B TaxID=2562794 RepID=UPI001E34A626
MDELVPKDYGEEIAVFRSQVIGPVVHRQLTRGELRGALRELAGQKFRPPGAERTRHFSVPTLERWYYRFRKHGLAALRPQPRKDAGRAKALDERQKQLLCDVRREHPSASAELIVATLVRQGSVREGAVSAATVRRLLAERGLDRVSLRGTNEGLERRRWEAAYPGALWHGDVCHGPVLTGGTKWAPLRIHALLDDRSRYVVALEARSSEREDDMLGLLVRAARQHGVPETLYLDNGSTYSGKTLATACPRLGIALVHARPYDPQARGKMERFWRTLREGCLDHLDRSLSLAEVQRRLDTFLARHYHSQPHASLMGDTPGLVWGTHQTRLVSESQLAEALTVRARRRVSRDGVVSLDGRLFVTPRRAPSGASRRIVKGAARDSAARGASFRPEGDVTVRRLAE